MCTGHIFTAWQAETIRHLINTKRVSLELLIGDSDIIEPIPNISSNIQSQNILKKILRPVKIFQRLLTLYRQFFRLLKTPLWNLYQQFENSYFPTECDLKVSMSDELINIDTIYCRTYKKGKHSQYFTKSDLDRIKSYELDMILRFGFNIIRGKILTIPTYGVWSFHHGNYLKYRGGPPGFWEIYNKDYWSGAILQQLTEKLDDGIVLYNSQFRTEFSSYNKNKNKLFWGTTTWPAIVCRNILANTSKNMFNKSTESTAPIYKSPTNLQVFRYLYIIINYKIESIFMKNPKIENEHWAIGIINSPIKELINSVQHPEVKWIEPPHNRFWADPFLIKKEDIFYIFFEDYCHNKKRGRISFIETTDFKTFSDSKPIIDTSFHLSYPFLLEHKNKYYCIPEQQSTGEIALYESISFPHKWTKTATLIKNFHGIDPTIIKHNDIWWMFCGNLKDSSQCKLYLFHSDKLEGPWLPHKKNPVKIFLKKARPAGAIFKYKGNLVRPAQNSTKTYGGSTIFYEIKTLTIDDYKENFIGELLPDLTSQYPDGIHHIMPSKNITIVDGKKFI